MRYLRQTTWFRKILLALMDAALLALALYTALMLRYETYYNYEFYNTFLHVPALIFLFVAAFAIGGIYDILWRYAGVNEAIRMTVSAFAASAVALTANALFRWSVSRPVLLMLPLLMTALSGGVRMLWRIVTNAVRTRKGRTDARQQPVGPRLMIVGAGIAGAYLIQMAKNDPGLGQPVLLVDDDAAKQKLRVQGVLVRGRTDEIAALAERYNIQEIIIAIPSLRGEALNALIKRCKDTKCRVRISTQIQSSDNRQQVFVRELNITDFLSRDEVRLDTEVINGYLTGKTVLVTGGGGSIGAELCRQIMHYSPKRMVVFDIYENCAYELQCELWLKYGSDCPVDVRIGSVRERARLDEIMDVYRPEVVFHAAAHKHVPLMEESPAEAVKNNVFGTLNVLDSASAHGAERFVSLSTDKAVNPTNVMGATKRIAEMLVQYYATKSSMKCMAVRFGNVLGSHGSVIPLFEKQIQQGGPVTVTHPDIMRYFMTIPEAAQLVLQAGGIARSGSVFVLDMGKPVRIDDLARQLIRFYGYEPGVNMEIVYTGLRPGEKLYEELLMPDETNGMQRTEHDQIMVAPPIAQDAAVFEKQLKQLLQAAKHNDAAVIAALHAIVPNFTNLNVDGTCG